MTGNLRNKLRNRMQTRTLEALLRIKAYIYNRDMFRPLATPSMLDNLERDRSQVYIKLMADVDFDDLARLA